MNLRKILAVMLSGCFLVGASLVCEAHGKQYNGVSLPEDYICVTDLQDINADEDKSVTYTMINDDTVSRFLDVQISSMNDIIETGAKKALFNKILLYTKNNCDTVKVFKDGSKIYEKGDHFVTTVNNQGVVSCELLKDEFTFLKTPEGNIQLVTSIPEDVCIVENSNGDIVILLEKKAVIIYSNGTFADISDGGLSYFYINGAAIETFKDYQMLFTLPNKFMPIDEILRICDLLATTQLGGSITIKL